MLGDDHLEHPLSEIREEGVGLQLWNCGFPLLNFRRRRIQRFKARTPEHSKSPVIKEAHGDAGGVVFLKFKGLVYNSR